MVTRLSAQLPAEVAVALLDTDARSLTAGTASSLQLGRAQTRGMGTGGEAAKEPKFQTQVQFITTSMSG